jgi:hypothetical protein
MKIDVYDTYAKTANGSIVHFDVFLKSGEHKDKALEYAASFLDEIGESTGSITLERCNFCHSEIANPEVIEAVELSGYFILRMEGCPKAYPPIGSPL